MRLGRARINTETIGTIRSIYISEGSASIIPIPEAPVQTAITLITYDSLQTNWLVSLFADGYYLTVLDPTLVPIPGYDHLDVGNVLTYSVTGLNPNINYTTYINAYNISGTSIDSNLENATTLTANPIENFGAGLYLWCNSQNVVLSGSNINSFTDLSSKGNNLSGGTNKAELNGEAVNGYISANFATTKNYYFKNLPTIPATANIYILLKTADTQAVSFRSASSYCGYWDTVSGVSSSGSGTPTNYINNVNIGTNRLALKNAISINNFLLLQIKTVSMTNYASDISFLGNVTTADFNGLVLEMLITDGATSQQDQNLIDWINDKYSLAL